MDPLAVVDTNVLLRLLQPGHPQYSVASAAITNLRGQFDLCILPQNLVEFWSVATRPPATNGLGLRPLTATAEIRGLRNLFRLLEGKPGIADEWEQLVARHLVAGKQAHDAHLVAAMNVYAVRHLLTFNGDDFKRYGLQVIAPDAVSVS